MGIVPGLFADEMENSPLVSLLRSAFPRPCKAVVVSIKPQIISVIIVTSTKLLLVGTILGWEMTKNRSDGLALWLRDHIIPDSGIRFIVLNQVP